jgi:hypothetical protein
MERFFLRFFIFFIFFTKIGIINLFCREDNDKTNNFIISKPPKSLAKSVKEEEKNNEKISQKIEKKNKLIERFRKEKKSSSYQTESTPKLTEEDSKRVNDPNAEEEMENASQQKEAWERKAQLRYANKYINGPQKEKLKIIGWNPHQNSFTPETRNPSRSPFGK